VTLIYKKKFYATTVIIKIDYRQDVADAHLALTYSDPKVGI